MYSENNTKTLNNRIWEIDFIRGIALLLMIYYHFIYDLSYFFDLPVSYRTGINDYIGKASGTLFIIISGISCRFSRNIIKRSLYVLTAAISITVITALVDYILKTILNLSIPNVVIKFGILHFLGISMLLFNLLKKLNVIILMVLSALFIALGRIFSEIKVSFDYLFPLGIYSKNFFSSDYYPLIPWLGYFILGIVIGKIIYKNKKSIFKSDIKDNIINYLGRKTLFIYLIHQPILIIITFTINLIFKFR